MITITNADIINTPIIGVFPVITDIIDIINKRNNNPNPNFLKVVISEAFKVNHPTSIVV